ncbi:MAG: carbon-nitrogen hydrolase family protein [Myxococcales bacterium]|nr:carbon-nitrogen hydrolase family protein [Myxococcales bacterium]
MELDLSNFETRIHLRQLTFEDYEAVVALQKQCFPSMATWQKEQFQSQVTMFSEGQFGIEIDGELVATAASLIVDYSDYADWHDWRSVADGGFIRNHDPEGDTLYGIEIQVAPTVRGMKISRRLYDERKHLCRRFNLARMVVGGRLPNYGACQDQMTAQEYVEAVTAKRLIDPVLTAQLSNGFVLKQLIKDYFPSDEDSAGYATFLEWSNLDYIRPNARRARHAVAFSRVAAVQYQMRKIATFEEFEQQCEFFVDTASDSKSDIVLFPELFTLQLLSLVKPQAPGSAARRLAEFTTQYLELFGDLAVRYNVNIVGGTQLTVEDDELYNISYLFRRDGSIGKQYKLHVTPNEKRWWGVEGGDTLEVFETDCGRIAILICYDVQFPELARIAVDKGAQILFVPYNTQERRGHLRVRTCAQARCIENHVYVVTAGCVGNLPFVENADIHYAQSGIFTPSDIAFARDGIAEEASPNLETVLIHDLDTELLRRHKRQGTVQNWNNRRHDIYRVAWKDAHGTRET